MQQYTSPYVGMGNRPSSNIDPNGMWAVGGPISYYEEAIAMQWQGAVWNSIVNMSSAVSLSHSAAQTECSGGMNLHEAAMAEGSGKSYYTGWAVTWTTGPFGISALSWLTESGNLISTGYQASPNDEKGRIYYNADKGNFGRYVQVSGTVWYLMCDGYCVGVYVSDVVCLWTPAGCQTPVWNDQGWQYYNSNNMDQMILSNEGGNSNSSHTQKVGAIMYGHGSGNNGPGAGYTSIFQLNSYDMTYSYGIGGVYLFLSYVINFQFSKPTPSFQSNFDINPHGLDSIDFIFGLRTHMFYYTMDGKIIDSGHYSKGVYEHLFPK